MRPIIDRNERLVIERLTSPADNIPLPERREREAIRGRREALDALVPRIRDVDDALGIDGDADGFIELPGIQTRRAKLRQVAPVLASNTTTRLLPVSTTSTRPLPSTAMPRGP